MKSNRFIDQYECSKIYIKGKLKSTKFLVIKSVAQKEEYFRVGIAVPKKNFKKATTRNKIRRQVRSILNECGFIKGDHLLIVKKTYDCKKDYHNLKLDICNFVKGK